MSNCLLFKKGEVEILSLGVGHPLATAFLDKPYGDFESMPRHSFADAMHTLIRQDESFEDDIDMLTKMLEYSTDWEERWEIITKLNEIKKQRHALADAKVMLNMLEMIWEEGAHGDDQSYMGLEWAVV